jgi:hypothetical protein
VTRSCKDSNEERARKTTDLERLRISLVVKLLAEDELGDPW